MSLAGRLDATQFRKWVRKRLEEIIITVQDFRKKPAAYLETLYSIPELKKYSQVQKKHITGLIANLLELTKDPGIGYQEMHISPLVLARDLGQLAAVQLLMKCETEGCDIEDYFGCEHCEETTLFYVKEDKEQWSLECIHHRNKKWSILLRIVGQCERLHDFSLPIYEVERKLEVLPSKELLTVVEEIINKYIPGYDFESSIGSFMVRGSKLYIYKSGSEC